MLYLNGFIVSSVLANGAPTIFSPPPPFHKVGVDYAGGVNMLFLLSLPIAIVLITAITMIRIEFSMHALPFLDPGLLVICSYR